MVIMSEICILQKKYAIWTVLFVSTKAFDKQLHDMNKNINKLEQIIYKLQSDIDIINNKE